MKFFPLANVCHVDVRSFNTIFLGNQLARPDLKISTRTHFTGETDSQTLSASWKIRGYRFSLVSHRAERGGNRNLCLAGERPLANNGFGIVSQCQPDINLLLSTHIFVCIILFSFLDIAFRCHACQCEILRPSYLLQRHSTDCCLKSASTRSLRALNLAWQSLKEIGTQETSRAWNWIYNNLNNHICAHYLVLLINSSQLLSEEV